MNPVIQKWHDAKDALLNETAGLQEVICLIPGWKPVSLEDGMQWLRASIYEGFHVSHRIVVKNGSSLVQFKIWEFGEDEPDYDQIET